MDVADQELQLGSEGLSLYHANLTMSQWGSEQHNNKKSLYRAKGLCHTDTSTRFITSNKPWLENYENKKEAHAKGQGSIMNTTVGKAMFNLNRTLPRRNPAEANQHIRYASLTQ